MASWFSTVIATSAFAFLAGCASKPALPSFGVVPDFTLTDQTGAKFSSTALDKKIWSADFIFTNCPGPCPRMSSQMHQVQAALAGNDAVRFVSFTVDPARDTPPVLAAYAQHFEADPAKWYFLTGAVADLNRMKRVECSRLPSTLPSMKTPRLMRFRSATAPVRKYHFAGSASKCCA